jgi:hypothetical protein
MNRSLSVPLVRSPTDGNDLKKRKLSSAFRVNSFSTVTCESNALSRSSYGGISKSLDINVLYENREGGNCLERKTSAFSYFLENNSVSEVCIVCELPLDSLSESEKEVHLNSCLDSKGVEKSNHDKGTVKEDSLERGLRCQEFYCVICDVNLSRRKLLDRCLHLKKCAKDHQMTTKQLLQFISPELDQGIVEEEEPREDADDDLYVVTGNVGGKVYGNNIISLLSDDDEEEDKQKSSDSSTLRVLKDGQVSNALSILMSNSKQQSSLLNGGGFETKKKPTTTSVGPKQMKSNNTKAKKNSIPFDLSITNPNKETFEGDGSKSNMKRFPKYKKKNIGGVTGGNAKPGGSFAPAYKKIQIGEMTYPIVVDGFQYASSLLSDCYFLTHFHSDHYMGLTKDFDSGTRFMSILRFHLSSLPVSLLSLLF